MTSTDTLGEFAEMSSVIRRGPLFRGFTGFRLQKACSWFPGKGSLHCVQDS